MQNVRYTNNVQQHQHRSTACTRNNSNELEPVQIAIVFLSLPYSAYSLSSRWLAIGFSYCRLFLPLVQMRKMLGLYTANRFYRPRSPAHTHKPT